MNFPHTTKTTKVIYWIATLWLALGMVATGIGQLMHIEVGQGAAEMIRHLGYPMYFLDIIGIWKILGAIAVLAPRFPLLKEWAYAGFFFTMTGALISHLAVGDPIVEILPSLLLIVLTILSWYFRPESRRLALVTTK